jgi:NAD(P)-dependent dehydrogenase (short-subunit alcohol dehydrogenase family)
MRNLSLYSVSKIAMERWSDYMNLEAGGQGVSFNTLRVDRIVATEGWYYVAETQGMDIATGGLGVASVLSVEVAGDHIAWMVRQPASWSGKTVGFQDVTDLGGPPCPAGTDTQLRPAR